MTTNATLPELVARFHLTDRLMRTIWSEQKSCMVTPMASIYLDEEIPLWYVWGTTDSDVKDEHGSEYVLVMRQQTWDILLSCGPALARLLDDGKTMAGMCYIPLDGVYRQAAEEYHERSADGLVPASDGITILEQRAQRLLEEVAAFSGGDVAHTHANRQAILDEAFSVEMLLRKTVARLDRVATTVDLAKNAAAVTPKERHLKHLPR